MHSKHLISVVPLLLSLVACSSDPDTTPASNGGSAGPGSGGKTSTGGAASAQGGASNAQGGATNAQGGATNAQGGASQGGSNTGKGGDTSSSKGGAGPGSGGSSQGGSSQGGSSQGGSSQGGRTGSSGGSSSGGSSSGGTNSATGGMTGTAGSGSTATFKCDNLSLKPSTTGVAKPSGAAGGLKVLDWAGFKGAVSYTFDDNNPSQVSQYSKLKATGAHFTFFVIASKVAAGSYKPFMTDGQEIANHSNTHPGDTSNAANEIKTAQTSITSNFGAAPISMAAPNCAPGWQAGGKGVVFFNRGDCGANVAAISPRGNTDTFNIPAWLPSQSTGGTGQNIKSPADSQAELIGAHAAGKWRIFVIHGFDTQNGTYQPLDIGATTAAMADGVAKGFWMETMSNVGAYWQGQKLIPESASTSATWTLPAQFPKNMCVRITTTGGTVTQKGEAIPWDEHGYYQISLDAGEVTVK